jgi:hypothetical protein
MKTVAVVVALLASGPAGQDAPEYTNLQVLPADISREELGRVMIENLRGLGLPRLAGRGCLECHVGDLETPRTEWDYASDAKPMKLKARAMMAMVKAINEDHLATLPERLDRSFEVSCTTCHAGRVDPRPLPTVLWETYEDDGIDGVVETYRDLRERYFARDAYDFRIGVLPRVATHMADGGRIDDAIALAALNVEVHPDSAAAKRAWIALTLERVVDAEGTDAALAALARMEPTLAPGVVSPSLLDGLAWRLNRSERAEHGHALIVANRARFPDEYIPLESLAFVLADTDRMDEALALLEAWLATHPEHARARRLLVNLRGE